MGSPMSSPTGRLWITAAVFAAVLAMAGCKSRRQQPIPGPQSAPTASAPMPASPPAEVSRSGGTGGHGVSGIAWFQDTLEAAFSRTCPERGVVAHY